MSLVIPTNHIYEVMIGNEWIDCDRGSFVIDAYEFVNDRSSMHDNDFQSFRTESGVTYVGFEFTSENNLYVIAGPMTAVQSVKWDDRVVTLGPKAIEIRKESAS